MTQHNREKIIDKIAKCMALSKSDNANEAAAALRQAQKLMEKYGISEKEINLTNIKELRFRVQKSRKRPPHWLTNLGHICAKAFNCEMYFTSEWEEDDQYRVFVFIGHKEHPQLAKYCYDVLLRQLIDIAELYRKEIIKEGDKCGLKRLNSFRLGWTHEVERKLESLKREDDQHEKINTSTGSALIILKNTLDLYMEEKHPNIKPFIRNDDTDPIAYLHGRIRGEKANLNQATEHKKQDNNLLNQAF